jgi:hypothetical protein
MLAWLRHLSAAVGTAEILTEALSESEEAQEYQQVRASHMAAARSRPCTCLLANGLVPV